MDIVGKSNRPVDRVVWERDYLSLESLTRLCERLSETEAGEQFVFREVELDCCYRQADGELRIAARSGNAERIVRATAVRERVFAAHDLVGTRELRGGIKELHVVADLVTGLR